MYVFLCTQYNYISAADQTSLHSVGKDQHIQLRLSKSQEVTMKIELLVFLVAVVVPTYGWLFSKSTVSGTDIQRTADKYIGSTKWSQASSHRTGANTNKCNIFVAEVLEEAGATVPHRHVLTWSPIGAGEWGNPNSEYLNDDSCWTHVTSAQVGDVIGDGVHVGIVTGSQLTTSARYDKVVKNDFGFRSSQADMTLWRFTC
ncbi:uncharacterized protein [Haliotis asinina]|uniref:uncharacterized protein n=1 Tax=Haliotis asinina TaxID=109174 RepID=UPI003531B4DF